MEVSLNSRAESLLGGRSLHQPSIRPRLSAMILLCEHPAVVAGAKVENGFIVFQGPQGRLLHRFTGCESAQSRSRPIRQGERSGAPAGYSRCERSLDRRCECASSGRVVRPNRLAAATLATAFAMRWHCGLAFGFHHIRGAVGTAGRLFQHSAEAVRTLLHLHRLQIANPVDLPHQQKHARSPNERSGCCV